MKSTPDLTPYSDTQLLEFVRDILLQPGAINPDQQGLLRAINQEIKRRGGGEPECQL